MSKPDWERELQKHARSAKSQGWCEQCQHPWFDGTCDCGHNDEPEVQAALKLWLANYKLPKPPPERPTIPCGQVMGHGESCTKDRLCGLCEYILYLEQRLGIEQEEDKLLPAEALEPLWDEDEQEKRK
jgi:hypothetical protein